MDEKTRFVNAFTWLYGGSKKSAIAVYKEADVSYIKTVIACFDGNCKKAFYED